MLSFVIVVIILVLLGASVLGESHVRVLAHGDKEIKNALAKGCKLVRNAKIVSAFQCDSKTAIELGLKEDIRVFAVDTGANTQIKANFVQQQNTGAGRKVVILDTGYNYNHQELQSSYFGGKDFVNSDEDPIDDNGHGSHVAGLITADGIDSKSKGVAPDAVVIAGKVLDNAGSGYFSDVVAAIYWAVDGPDGIYGTVDDFGADAISMSLGTSTPYTYKGFCDATMPDMTNAIKYAVDHGISVVVAAGNNGNAGVSLPGCISHAITVGAVDSRDRIASFSGRGNAVDISAPGVSLYSAWGSGYATASGTSMATPVVTGTIALIKAVHSAYNPSQIQNALFKTSKDLGKFGKDTSFGWGRVDAYGAVNYLQ